MNKAVVQICALCLLFLIRYCYAWYSQKNGAVSKVNKSLLLTLHGQNVHRQQRQLSKFLMCYQQFASHAYCGAAGPVSKMALQQGKAFCVLRFEVPRSVITVQREFRERFRTAGSAFPLLTVYVVPV
jgi:hypothetical protein